MRKVSISLEEGKTHKKVGLAIYGHEGEGELRKVIGLVEGSLHRNFPDAEITRQRAVRKLFEEE
jgi:hypothetical protein